MNYGLPYMGSKSMIAEWVVEQLPRAAHFYDLFAGGCAVTHAAMAAGRYTDYHINDITESVQLFAAAVRGEYRGEKRWISREFDHDRFYEWAERQENIFISEYSMPSEFKCVAEHAHRSRLSANANKTVVERLFVPVRHKYYTYTQLSLFE